MMKRQTFSHGRQWNHILKRCFKTKFQPTVPGGASTRIESTGSGRCTMFDPHSGFVQDAEDEKTETY
jgi:hypothetical protein